MNLSIEGYGTDPEFLVLEQEGLRYHPRLSPPLRAIRWLTDEFHLLNRLRESLPLASPPSPFSPVRRERQRFVRCTANELTVRIACQVRDVVRRTGAELLVLLHPDEPTFAHRSPVAAWLAPPPPSPAWRAHSLSYGWRATSSPSSGPRATP